MGLTGDRWTYWRRYVIPDLVRGLVLFLVCAILVLAVVLLLAHIGGPAPDNPCDITSRTGC